MVSAFQSMFRLVALGYGCFIIVSFWNELNNMSEEESGVEDLCLCYPTCNQTLYSQEMSWAPYPGPLAHMDGITKAVFNSNPTKSHLCYAK